MQARDLWQLVKQAFDDWNQDNAPRLGAALSYYTLFSLAPLLIVAIAVAGLVFGQDAAQGQIVGELRGLVGPAGAQAVEEMIKNSRREEAGILATVLGLITLFLGATGAFAELKSSLNVVWDVESPSAGVWGLVRSRLWAFALVLAVGFLLLVSLIVSAAVAATDTILARFVTEPSVILHALNTALSLIVITALFALIFKYLPDAAVSWGDVWVGAVFTSALFTLGKFLIGLYLGHSSLGSVYGAAGSIVVVMVWVYYAAQIFFFGAELTQAYARRHGSWRERRQPAPHGQGALKPSPA
ncbi:MAG TPA: YihY/virulence factor BrkB family protein [Vicinamibacteria bacterium]